MKIAAIHTYVVDAPLSRNFGFSQWEYSRRSTMLVEIATDAGIEGWGEAYGPAKPTAAAIDDFFSPMLIGRDPRDTESLWHFLFARSIDYGQKGTLLGGDQRARYRLLGYQGARRGPAALPVAGRVRDGVGALLRHRILFRGARPAGAQ